ncbi:MAG: hypothetical protein ACI4HI_16490 [Lachnospiraceae bacterium]
MKKNIRRAGWNRFFCVCMALLLFITPVQAQTVKAKVWKKVSTEKASSTQGMCMDQKKNVYISIVHADQSVGIYKLDSHKKRHLVAYEKHAFGHANDMTYNPKTGYIYVVTGGNSAQSGHSYDILALDPSKKNRKGNYRVVEKYRMLDIAGWISGIAYDETKDLFYIKQANKIYVVSLKKGKYHIKGKFKIAYGVNTKNRYVTQGITVHNGKIYLPFWDMKQKNSSIVRKYRVRKKRNGTYKATYEKTVRYRHSGKMEMEGIGFTREGKVFFNANCEDRNGKTVSTVLVKK